MVIRKEPGSINAQLELLLYNNRLQLASGDALYSDGVKYRPATAAIDHLKAFMPHAKQLLILGTGLGSTVEICRKQGYNPHFTLVEYDKTVLQWALELMPAAGASQITPVCMDAALFMSKNTHLYDLVFIDIFKDRIVPDFVTTALFMKQCRAALAPGGKVAFNYMVMDNAEWQRIRDVFTQVFPQHDILDLDTNRILIGSTGV